MANDTRYFIKSEFIKVFPSAFRDANKDAGSRLNSEYNLTIPKTLLKTNYVIEKPNYDDGSHWTKFIIKGYYFEVKSAEIPKYDGTNRCSYVGIKLTKAISEGETYNSQCLKNLNNDSSQSLDAADGNFYGLEFFKTIPSDTTYILLVLTAENGDIYPINANQVYSGNLNFPITGNLTNGSKNGAIIQITNPSLGNTADALNAIALGKNNSAHNPEMVAIGRYNSALNAGTGELLSIGDGTGGSTARHTLLNITSKDGNRNVNINDSSLNINNNNLNIFKGSIDLVDDNPAQNEIYITSDEIKLIDPQSQDDTIIINKQEGIVGSTQLTNSFLCLKDGTKEIFKIDKTGAAIISNTNHSIQLSASSGTGALNSLIKINPANSSINAKSVISVIPKNSNTTFDLRADGTIMTGKWNGATIAVAYGGTGATTAAEARNNLVVPGLSTTNTFTGTKNTFKNIETTQLYARVPSGAASDFYIIKSEDEDGYQIFSVDKSGNVTANTYNATSDKRLKENIVEYKPIKSILDLPVYKYDFIDGAKNQIGCLAQDLQEICPEIVNENKEGYLSIQENKLVYLLLDEVKKLKEEIKELKNK